MKNISSNLAHLIRRRFSSGRRIPTPIYFQRRLLSDGKESARDVARRVAKERRGSSGTTQQASSSSSGLIINLSLATATCGGLLWMTFTDQGNEFAQTHLISKESYVGSFFKAVNDLLMAPFAEHLEPSSEKLLPDFPPIPPGHVAHRTLVLSLEGTLCHSEWDKKNGWRAAKRPGVDAFLMRMCQMYEVVIFSSGQFLTEQPLTMQLDKNHAVSHFLFRDSTLYEDGIYIKDLSRLNRDLARVVVVDDDREALKRQPENLVQIKSFKDPHSEDHELQKLGDFLEDLFRRDVKDIREELKRYGDRDILDTFYVGHVERVKRDEEQRAQGLGGFIRRQRK